MEHQPMFGLHFLKPNARLKLCQVDLFGDSWTLWRGALQVPCSRSIPHKVCPTMGTQAWWWKLHKPPSIIKDNMERQRNICSIPVILCDSFLNFRGPVCGSEMSWMDCCNLPTLFLDTSLTTVRGASNIHPRFPGIPIPSELLRVKWVVPRLPAERYNPHRHSHHHQHSSGTGFGSQILPCNIFWLKQGVGLVKELQLFTQPPCSWEPQ